MADRKEERERLRAERLAAESRVSGDDRKRLLLGYFVAGLLGALVLAGIVVAIIAGGDASSEEAEANEAAGFDPNTGFRVPPAIELDEREGTAPPPVEQADLELAAEAAGCELMLDLEDEGSTHIEPDAKTPDYKTSPPNSGDHSPENLADGAYLEYPEPINSTHSLEHGRTEIHYSPDLPEDEQLALKGLFDEDQQGMLMFPNPDMDYEVAVSAWTNLLACDTYDPEVLDAIRAFRDTFRGQGPESVPF
ncbi:MAG: DUF3105 domain-containing protein [Solirubrobacterales bacterium]